MRFKVKLEKNQFKSFIQESFGQFLFVIFMSFFKDF